MKHAVTTKNLVFLTICGEVWDRESYRLGPYVYGTGFLGYLRTGPILPVDIEIADQWRQIQEWASTHAGR